MIVLVEIKLVEIWWALSGLSPSSSDSTFKEQGRLYMQKIL